MVRPISLNTAFEFCTRWSGTECEEEYTWKEVIESYGKETRLYVG